MHRLLIALGLSVIGSCAIGQTYLQRIVRDDVDSKITEIYYEDPDNVRQGEYEYKYWGRTQVAGQYCDNKKCGIWVYTPSRKFKITGKYVDDRRQGDWVYVKARDTLAILSYDHGIRSGRQLGFHKNGNIAKVVSYIVGRPEGPVFNYHENGKLKMTGNYKAGSMVGEWRSFDGKGNLVSVREYSDSEEPEVDGSKAAAKDDRPNFLLDEMPRFCGRDIDVFRRFIRRNLIYPPICAEHNIEGTVYVRFNINTLGEVVDAEIATSVNHFMDKEALRVVNLSPSWIPGKYAR